MTFTVHTASAGGWHAFVSAPRLLLVAAPDDTFVSTAWATIVSPDGFQSALDLLTGRGLAATPPFVLIEWAGEDARVIVRGESPLTVTDAAGEQLLSAAGVSTWVERSMPGVTGVSFTVPGATPVGSAALPLERGVAYVAALSSQVSPADAKPAEAAPAEALEAKPTPAPAAPPAPTAASAPPPAPAPEPEVDIEATRREAPEAVSAPPAPAAPVSAPEEAGYDYLFGDTMYRSVADAAVHEPEPVEEGDAPAEPIDDALHDGETVMTSDIAKLRGKRRPKNAVSAPPVQPEAQKLVLVIAPTGAREPLTQPILMGRSPSVGKVSGGLIPRLVTIGTVDQDISRNHAQFALEGGTVVITDLHSRNGTLVALPGKSPQKLRAGEPTSVIVGTVVDFGGGVTVTVEEES